MRQTSVTKRGRPARYTREQLLSVVSRLRDTLSRETRIKADELLEADPLDASHLFFEELRMTSRALREIGPEEVTDEDLSEIMPAVD